MYRELYRFGGVTFALESDAPLERSPVCEAFHVPDGVPDHTICLRFSDALPTPPADALRRDDVFRWQAGAQRHLLQWVSAPGDIPHFTYAVTHGAHTDVIFAKPQELGSKNLYAYCDNNPVAREDYAGEFPIPCIVGAVVGAAVSGFSYVLTSGGEIDGVELAKSCLIGAVSGALAPLDPTKWAIKPLVACAAVINTVINTEGDIGTRFLCGAFEAGVTYISGVTANSWTGGKVVLETVSAKIIGNAAVGYTVGQTAELAAVGLAAAVKSGANASKKTNSATSNARTTKRSNTRVITTVSGRKKVINKVKKPTRRNTKFQRVCMA